MRKEEIKTNQPALFYQISDLLKKSDVKYKMFDIKPEYTSEKVSTIMGTQASQEAKSLVVVGDDKTPFLVVIARLKSINLSALKNELNLKDIRMATPEEVKKNTRSEVGAVSPFGNLTGLPLYVDSQLSQQEEIAFSVGLRTKIVVMPFEDFKMVTNPIIGDYIKE
jgi:Ala-tRNA(Pro) deacylase